MTQQEQKVDWLTEYILERRAESPDFDRAFEASKMRNELVRIRHRAKLSQKEIAKRLGVSQPRVAEIESMDNDPRLSTLIEYARAVGAEIRVVQVNEPKAEYGSATDGPKSKSRRKPVKNLKKDP